MDEKIKQIVCQVKERLLKIYGEKVADVILYGSHVRNEATEDSDIDLLVLVDESLDPSKVRESLSDFLFDILLEEKELVSVLVLHKNFFETHNYPFILNVKREGLKI